MQFGPRSQENRSSGIARRSLLLSLPALALASPAAADFTAMAALELDLRARIGVYAMTASGQRLYAYHPNEWAAMCSTFKLLLAGAVLSKVDQRAERLDRMIRTSREELVPPISPVTAAQAEVGQISVERLVAGMLETSDNTSANLLLRSVGGPEEFTRWLRDIGDPSTRLDRYEPDLNSALLGDPRDSTTPKAMAETVRTMLFGDALSSASKSKIINSMVACTTGLNMLRAGLPKDWRVGDRTGRGGNGATNDVAVIFPPGDAEAVIVAVYLTDCPAPLAEREAAIAQIGRMVVDYFPGGKAPGAPKFVTP